MGFVRLDWTARWGRLSDASNPFGSIAKLGEQSSVQFSKNAFH